MKGGHSHDDEFVPYADDDHGDDWDFVDALVECHIDVRVSLPRDFNTICELCHLVSVSVPEGASEVFSMDWPSLNSMTEHNSEVAAKAMALGCACVDDEKAAESPDGLDS